MKWFIVLLFLLSMAHAAELYLSGQNSLRTAVDSLDSDEPGLYFQEWFDLTVSMGDFTIDIGLEAHTPPFPGSFSPYDTIGIMKRLLTWSKDGITVEAGTFFPSLGNGITFHASEDRDLGWNTNVEGARFLFSGDKVEGEFFGGKMRDTDAVRYSLLEGTSVRFMPGDIFFPGFTAVTTKIDDKNHYWGSLTGELYLPFGQIKGEFAAYDFAKRGSGFTVQNMFGGWSEFLNYGRAAYLNGTFYAGPLTLFLEGKNYKSFALENQSLVYNNPPTAVREHLFALFSDNNPDGFKGGNEKGFLTEVSGPLPGENLFTLSYSNTRKEENQDLLFDELYGQLDITVGELKSITGFGIQRDEAGHYIHGGLHGEFPIEKIRVKGEFAHQHKTLNRNFEPARKFFYQTYELGVGIKDIQLSLLGAATSDPGKGESDGLYTKGWFGGQVNLKIKEKHSLALFGGTRKDGKICAGGVCVKKPELKGIELSLTSMF